METHGTKLKHLRVARRRGKQNVRHLFREFDQVVDLLFAGTIIKRGWMRCRFERRRFRTAPKSDDRYSFVLLPPVDVLNELGANGERLCGVFSKIVFQLVGGGLRRWQVERCRVDFYRAND